MQDITINKVVSELRETAQHMMNLAELIEDANIYSAIKKQLEDSEIGKQIAGSMDQSTTTILLAQALMLANKVNGCPQLNIGTPAGPKTNNTQADTPAPAAANPATTDQTESEPPKTHSVDYTTKAMEAFQKENIPVASPIETWSNAKCEAYYKNLNLHPDSIDNNGCFDRKTAWRIKDVRAVLAHKDKNPEEIADMVRHSPDEIRRLIDSLQTNAASNAPEQTTPKAGLNQAQKKPADPEEYLPKTVQNPGINQRVKIIRLWQDYNREQLADSAKIDRTNLERLENSAAETDRNLYKKLAASLKVTLSHFGLNDDTTKNIPIKDIIKLAGCATMGERTRAIRCRFGLGIDEIAKKLDVSVDEYRTYEAIGPDDKTADKIAAALGINPEVYADVRGKYIIMPDKSGDILVGKNIQAIRTQRGINVDEAAKSAGVTAKKLKDIEAGKAHAELEDLHMLSMTLNCKISDLNPNEID